MGTISNAIWLVTLKASLFWNISGGGWEFLSLRRHPHPPLAFLPSGISRARAVHLLGDGLLNCLVDIGCHDTKKWPHAGSKLFVSQNSPFNFMLSTTMPLCWVCFGPLERGSSSSRDNKVPLFNNLFSGAKRFISWSTQDKGVLEIIWQFSFFLLRHDSSTNMSLSLPLWWWQQYLQTNLFWILRWHRRAWLVSWISMPHLSTRFSL